MKNISLFHQLAGWAAVRAGSRRGAAWLLLGLLGALAAQAQPAAVQQNNYPAADRIGWVNVKSYGAKGDGVTDDTRAIRRAITTYPRQYLSRIVVYFPDGNYLVSDSLRERDGYYDGYVTFQGQSTAGTVIKLQDNAPGFQDVANPRPVVHVTRGGNQSFNQYFFNLTINTGRGNPGAVALDYITSNLGAVKNVVLTSDDGQGYCGLQMDRQWPGPGLIKNVTISGFQYGVSMSNSEYSMTFENLVLRNQSVLGIRNAGNEAIIRGLTSDNAVPVIETANQLVLLDGTFRGGAAGTPAIVNTGFAYVRNTTAGGYPNIISTNGAAVPGTTLQEYSSQAPASAFPTQSGLMLNLPVKETPEYINNDTTQWANVRDYGVRDTDPLYGQSDATAGIQAAFNSGKPVVYFPSVGSNGSAYQIYQDITIPASVKLIMGFGFANVGQNNGARLLVQQASADALIFERINVGKVLNTSTRAVAFKHTQGDYDNGPNSGELFIEDFVGRVVPSYAMNMWARQLNTEVQLEGDLDVLNLGGNYWILGQKTEGRAIVNKTTNGGSSEILGGLIYPASGFDTGIGTALVSENGCIAAIFSASSFISNGFYPVYASETRNGETKQLREFTQFYRAGCAAATPPPPPAPGAGTGLAATYYNTRDLSGPAALPRTDATLDFDWGTGSPAPEVNADDFSARWSGQVLAPATGDYTFATVSDDGVRLWVNGQLLIDNWTDHGPTTDTGTLALVAGQKYDIRLEYYEAGGGAVCRLQWSYAGQARQAIPQGQLFPATTPAPGDGPAGYAYCSDEGARCPFVSPTDVAYGANGSFVYQSGLSGGCDCTNAFFGSDPAPGVVKKCYTRATAAALLTAADTDALPTAAAALAVYPNPAREQLTVRARFARAGATSLSLTDALGRVVRQLPPAAAEAGELSRTLELRGLPAGLYLLRVQQAGQTYTRKVVVQP